MKNWLTTRLKRFETKFGKSRTEAKKELHSEKGIEHAKQKFTDVHSWNAFKMNKEMGKKTAMEWRASGKIVALPDPVTGSLEKHALRWQVPVAWERMSESDFKKFTLDITTEANADDIQKLATLTAGQIAGSFSSVPIKEEPMVDKTPEEKMKQRVLDFEKESSLAAALRKFQNIEIETTQMTTQALDTSGKSKSKFISMLGNDLKKNMVHIKDIIGILTGLVGKKKNIKSAKHLPDLLESMDAVEQQHETNKGYGVKFGFKDISGKDNESKTRKKRKTV